MSIFKLSNRAEHDLLDIFVFGIEKFGLIQAQIYGQELSNCFEIIAQNPKLGREAKTIALGVRRHEHKSHIILYEEMEFGVLILAIVHKKNVVNLRLE